MKKRLVGFMAAILTMVLLAGTVFATTFPIRVVVNGAEVYFPDGNPFMDKSSRILVPVRFVSEQLGAEVGWNKDTQTVTVKEEEKLVTLVVGKKEITINGAVKQLDTNATLKSSRTYVPLRFISEALGAEVKWDGKANTVYINNGKAPIPQVKVFKAGPFTISSKDVKKVHVDKEDGSVLTTTKNLDIHAYKIIDETRCIMILAPTRLTQSYLDGYLENYNEQCDEAGSILKQVISEKTVNEIISFAKKKTDREVMIGKKTYYEGQYEVLVDGSAGTNINIKVYYK